MKVRYTLPALADLDAILIVPAGGAASEMGCEQTIGPKAGRLYHRPTYAYLFSSRLSQSTQTFA